MTYAVYTTENFEKEIEELPKAEIRIIKKIFLQLKNNPYVGDSIRYPFFREKRIRKKRMYYLIYNGLSAVLVVAFGGKKEQQKTIERITKYLPEFKKYISRLLG